MDDNYGDDIMAQTNLNMYVIQDSFSQNSVIYYNLAGEIVCSKTFDLDQYTANTIPIPSALEYLSPTSHPLILGTNDTTKRTGGYINVNGSLLVVTCVPVQDSSFTGTTQGLVLWGFFQSNFYTQNLAAREQLCVTFHALNANATGSTDDILYNRYKSLIANNKPIAFSVETPFWNNTNPIQFEMLPEPMFLTNRQCWDSNAVNASGITRMSAFGYVLDIFGVPATIIRADIDLNILLSLEHLTMGLSMGLVAAITLIAIAVMILFVEFAVLSPMLRLTYTVKQISDSGDVHRRLTEQGKDELGRLAQNFNYMLLSLDDSQQLLAEEHNKLHDLVQRTSIEEQFSRSMMNSINDFLLVVLTDGMINQTNTSFLEKFQYAQTDVNGRLSIDKIIQNGTIGELIELCNKVANSEFNMLGKFQEIIPVLVTVNEIDMFVKDQRVKAYVVVARNISEKKSMMDNLARDRKKMADLERDLEFNSVWRDPIKKKGLDRYCTKMKCEENVKVCSH
jgi:PAS domain S-box-containing protein